MVGASSADGLTEGTAPPPCRLMGPLEGIDGMATTTADQLVQFSWWAYSQAQMAPTGCGLNLL